MKPDKETPIYIQVKKLAKKHKLTTKQEEEWSMLCQTAYFIGPDDAFNILKNKTI